MHRPSVASVSLAILAAIALADEKPKLDLSKLPAAATGTIDFPRDIAPLLAKGCVKCHGPDRQSAGLRLDSAAEMIKGSDAGPVLKAGDGANSRLLHLVAGIDPDARRMPPKGKGDPLTSDEIGKLRAWIDHGANWPADLTLTATTTVPKSDHWAFQPIKRPAVPTFSRDALPSADWPRNEIDHFILARLQKEGIAPSPEADRTTLIRRLSLDLLGLPPTPDEVDAFLKDDRADAYERLVDRLFANPHYGERWGRHWLDMARYADSDGFEKDSGRPHAWRYRHWVIDALNRDLPYDQFIIEQLAGDLLPNATTEQKVATGFHRNTLTNREGGVDQEQFRVEQVVDRVNTTGKVFLGITIGCCQCHDHKYDPFTQREYYQMFAFFNNDKEADIPAPLADEIEPYNRKKAEFDKKLAELKTTVAVFTKDQLPANQLKWENELKVPDLRKLPANVVQALLLDPAKRDDKQKKEVADHYTTSDPKLAELNKAVADHQKTEPKLSQAQTLALAQPRKTHVMVRGDFLRPSAEVQPRTPAVFPPLRQSGEPGGESPRVESTGATRGLTPPGSPSSPTRLDLARWIVDPGNPLTARVAINWVWQRYFGRGFVATLEDFGTQGEKPSHPELLDWLASELVAKRWSLKELHKLIVTSATYRQSSKARPELRDRDAVNVLLARQSRLRLEAEVIRDNALAASGLLVRKVGGASVRPPQPAGISELTYAGAAKWTESSGADRFRRGLYTWFQRTSPYPMLMTFDAPDSNVCTVRRERSNTPLQALTLLNDTAFVECAQALAKRVIMEIPDTEGREAELRHAFRLCLGRAPSANELAILGRLFEEVRQECAKASTEERAKLIGAPKNGNGTATADHAALVVLARALLNLDEFVTRE